MSKSSLDKAFENNTYLQHAFTNDRSDSMINGNPALHFPVSEKDEVVRVLVCVFYTEFENLSSDLRYFVLWAG